MLMSDYLSLEQLPFDDEFKNALGELEQKIFDSYDKFMPAEKNRKMNQEFKEGLGYTLGQKYLRVVMDRHSGASVWGFVACKNFKVKSKRKTGPEYVTFQEGDLLKSAGWKTPALNSPRGNIFDNYSVAWTGPHYL